MIRQMNLPGAVIGDTLTFSYTFTDPDTQAPLDITGYTFWFTVKSKIHLTDEEAEIQIEYTAPNSAESQSGRVDMIAHSSKTRLLRPSTYKYDFKVRIPGSPEPTILSIVSGTIPFKFPVTRSY